MSTEAWLSSLSLKDSPVLFQMFIKSNERKHHLPCFGVEIRALVLVCKSPDQGLLIQKSNKQLFGLWSSG